MTVSVDTDEQHGSLVFQITQFGIPRKRIRPIPSPKPPRPVRHDAKNYLACGLTQLPHLRVSKRTKYGLLFQGMEDYYELLSSIQKATRKLWDETKHIKLGKLCLPHLVASPSVPHSHQYSNIMRYSTIIAALTAFAFETSLASPTTKRQCVELQVPVRVTTTATKWLQPRVDNTIDAVEWVLNFTTWTSPADRAIGTINIDQIFQISGKLCIPQTPGPRSEILHLATHGVGFDKRYWDVEVNPKEYSYVESVLSSGYSIFTYDRLGTGLSEKPDAYDMVQTSVQIEILKQLTLLVRSGKLISSSKRLTISTPALDKYRPEKIIQVGHSFGSITIAGLISQEGQSSTTSPSLTDGAILTGFLISDPTKAAEIGMGPGVAGWGFEYARSFDPVAFADRGSGYLVQAAKSSVHLNFFKQEKGKGGFDPKLLDYAYETRQPNTVGEFVSFPSIIGSLQASKKFKGPIQFVIGENDYAFCRGDCKGTYDVDWLKWSLYPEAKGVEVYLQPGTGHGLTFGKNASGGYKSSFGFLGRFGL